MKKTLIIKENREIQFADGQHIADCVLGVVGEKNATILNFIKPQKINNEAISNYTMRAVFNNEAGSFSIDVNSSELALDSNITAYTESVLCVQFLKDNEVKWSSFPVKVYFVKGLDDSGIHDGQGGLIAVPATAETLGLIKVGENLKITEDGVLSVDTANVVEQDNTKPITSAAVHTEIGNIEVLLAAL